MSSPPAPLITFVIPLYFTRSGIDVLLEVFRGLEVPGGFNPVLANEASTNGRAERVVKRQPPGLPFGVTLVAALMAALSIFSGGQLLMPGLLGEYVGRAYMTSAGKPQSLIHKMVGHHPAVKEGGA